MMDLKELLHTFMIRKMRNTHVVNKSHLAYRTLLIRGGIIWSVGRELLEFALKIRFVLLFDSPPYREPYREPYRGVPYPLLRSS